MTNSIQSTFNIDIPIKCFSIFDEEINNRTCNELRYICNSIGRVLDISSLVGISIAYGDEAYKQAIAEIEPSRTPSSGSVIGVAMTLDKVIDGKYANYIILHQNAIYGLIIDSRSKEDIGYSIQTLSHECAHVYSNTEFYETFGSTFEPSDINPYKQIVKSVASATWSEYSACLLSANIGLDPTQDFLEVLCGRLDDMNQDLTSLLERKPSNYDLLTGVTQILGNIVKYAGYYIGCLHSFDLRLESEISQDLARHQWIMPYLYELESVLIDITDKFSEKSVSDLDLLKISDIFIEIAEYQGFKIGNDPIEGAFIFTNR